MGKVFDPGLADKSKDGSNVQPSRFQDYLDAVGDPNNNGVWDDGEGRFLRATMRYGHVERLGSEGAVTIRCVAVRGDTKGREHDLDLEPGEDNPGSIALVVRFGEFEFYTAGDQTSNDWKHEYPDTEEKMVDAGAIPGGNDIDVLKVSHHGSDTSTGRRFANALRPEVSIISTQLGGHGLPKRVVLKVLEESGSVVLVTGTGRDAKTGRYTDSGATSEDDAYTPSSDAAVDAMGDVTVLVSADGGSYTVSGGSRRWTRTFSARDADNRRREG